MSSATTSGIVCTCIWLHARNAAPRLLRCGHSSGAWGHLGTRTWTRRYSGACWRLPSLASLFPSGGGRQADPGVRVPPGSCTRIPKCRPVGRAARADPRTGGLMVPRRRGARQRAARWRAAQRRAARRSAAWRGAARRSAAWRGAARPRAAGRRTAVCGRSARRSHYVIASVASFLVVGVSGLSFVVGGGQGAPGPRITPPVEMFTVEHSVTTGELPFANPAATFLPAPVAPRGGP